MRRSDFHYELPAGRIAQQPLPERSASRMLCLDRADGSLADRGVRDLPDLLAPGDLMVFNDTRVIPARLYGRKATGGALELLVERVLDTRRFTAKLRASKTPRPGGELRLGDGDVRATVADRAGELFTIELADADVGTLLESHGHVPLPPYIERSDEPFDRERYQTVWARREGAVAAPTAGLHFDDALLEKLRERGVEFGYVTLHVGSGTYQRVRDEDLSRHRLHAERIDVGETLCRRVAETRERGGRVVAVGTTVVRSLEAAAACGELKPFAGETDLFIRPGYRFNVVDALVTNFHEPESTLLMLVCAFAGREKVLAAYRHAVTSGYRFLSYGDAMFIR
ncbi:S-adenosylmethionine:tRNA ribosyltransferase-isomerase [Salinisphaera sp. PC39]|uniref:tRNA preQ1(34) S-adenosylmethionine ribosyltransferase-isomerase QueA n=1 Tax=Salinisphaera sp. PC39 TaxID=1304156 RepID=UPI00334255D2